MDDQLKYLLENCKKSMEASVTHLENELLNIRAGKANPSMLKSVHVNYYGNETPINQLANINTPDSKTIVIQPWEKSIPTKLLSGSSLAMAIKKSPMPKPISNFKGWEFPNWLFHSGVSLTSRNKG